MSWSTSALVTIATFVLMEPISWALHRYVMHGFGWSWHRTHHEPSSSALEKNDLFSLVFSAASALSFALGYYVPELRGLWSVALGVTLYGFVYFLLHDCLIHQRIRLPFRVKSRYLKRLVQSHRLHHATRGRDGAVSFGFLYAPPPERLAQEIRARRERGIPLDRAGAMRA